MEIDLTVIFFSGLTPFMSNFQITLVESSHSISETHCRSGKVTVNAQEQKSKKQTKKTIN